MFEKDIIITGTHASYIKEMKEVAGLFARNLDIYMLAPIMGFLNNRKGQKNNEGGEKSTIQAQQLSNVKEDCELIYRLIILLDGDDIDKDERLNRAFRYDSDVEKKKEFDNAMEIYNEYVLGGIEYMYETFVAGCVEVDDYTTKIFEAASDFQDEINELDYSQEVKKYF